MQFWKYCPDCRHALNGEASCPNCQARLIPELQGSGGSQTPFGSPFFDFRIQLPKAMSHLKASLYVTAGAETVLLSEQFQNGLEREVPLSQPLDILCLFAGSCYRWTVTPPADPASIVVNPKAGKYGMNYVNVNVGTGRDANSPPKWQTYHPVWCDKASHGVGSNRSLVIRLSSDGSTPAKFFYLVGGERDVVLGRERTKEPNASPQVDILLRSVCRRRVLIPDYKSGFGVSRTHAKLSFNSQVAGFTLTDTSTYGTGFRVHTNSRVLQGEELALAANAYKHKDAFISFPSQNPWLTFRMNLFPAEAQEQPRSRLAVFPYEGKPGPSLRLSREDEEAHSEAEEIVLLPHSCSFGNSRMAHPVWHEGLESSGWICFSNNIFWLVSNRPVAGIDSKSYPADWPIPLKAYGEWRLEGVKLEVLSDSTQPSYRLEQKHLS
jgi:hypothetical protein